MENSRNQTNTSFLQKWSNGREAFLSVTLNEQSEIFSWILNRNGFGSPIDFTNWLSPRKRILDAGCGNGRVTHLLRRYSLPETEIVGVDYSSHQIAEANFKGVLNSSFRHADLMEDMSELGFFDLIYCQEVLHHTENPHRSFLNLVNLLNRDGEIAIYVYKKKAINREFSDDHIREMIKSLSFEEARDVISQITDFAKVVSQIPGKISFPGLPALGIKSQELSIHRFIYNNFFKNFWNEDLSYEENFLVNFDWYHPSTCFRHTMPEVLGWFKESGLSVIHAGEDDYGITIRGVRS